MRPGDLVKIAHGEWRTFGHHLGLVVAARARGMQPDHQLEAVFLQTDNRESRAMTWVTVRPDRHEFYTVVAGGDTCLVD